MRQHMDTACVQIAVSKGFKRHCPKISKRFICERRECFCSAAVLPFYRHKNTWGPVGQRPKRPVPGGQRRVVSRLGVLDLLFGILKFPLQVRPWPERIGNGCRFAALQRRVDPTTFYQGLSPRGRGNRASML